MKISVDHLAYLINKYHGIEIRYLKSTAIRGQRFPENSFVLQNHPDLLRSSKVGEVQIVYNKNLYSYLNVEFPEIYRKPFGSMQFMEMDRTLERYAMINAQSRRKRRLHLVGDIYGLDVKDGSRETVLGHNEPIEPDRWNDVKRAVGRDHVFYYRRSEVPIIIFVDLSMDAETGYVDRFKRNMDLISVMVSHPISRKFEIAPDFIPTEDVISVTDPEALLEEYVRSNARLIIIGEKLNEAYKKALIRVRQYDKFVRMLVIPKLDHRSLSHFFQQVKLVYNADRWNE